MADPSTDILPGIGRPGDGQGAGVPEGRPATDDRPGLVEGTKSGLVPVGRMVWRRAFAGLAEEAPSARAFVRCLLAGTRWMDDAELAVAELVNNALFHSRSGDPGGYFVVEVTRCPRSVRVGVYDLGGGGAPGLDDPQMRASEGRPDEALREYGRGLEIVRLLATRVGYRGSPDGGHLVWALFGGPAVEETSAS
ncbi:ATP-binding protein [Sphaerisporangium corydalis]|uniref:ATP-binding protein n=1 Tax=Sphaerisporangium corydalis TaxID=1441875 RepID=A0ABV9EPW4_9ACTN|nr:ATP-binding protein [Sphaerisporangium corydalis]